MREDIEALRVLGFWRWFWYKTLYRRFQKFAHRHDWHHVTSLGPFEDGTRQKWCQWCGLRHVIRPTAEVIEGEIASQDEVAK